MLLRREAVRPLAGIQRRLLHPVPDRLGRRLKLAPELLRGPAPPDQLNHLPPERRRVRPMALRHRGLLPPQRWGVHETGSTPMIFRSGDRITPEDLDLLTRRSSGAESKVGAEPNGRVDPKAVLSWLQHEALRIVSE